MSAEPHGTVYTTRADSRQQLHRRITAASSDLRERLEMLRQAAHAGADPADVDAVRAAIWAAHGYR